MLSLLDSDECLSYFSFVNAEKIRFDKSILTDSV